MRLLLLPGDGIGPEIVAATVQVLRAANDVFSLDLTFEERSIGFDALKATGTTMPEEVLDAARAADGLIMGPVSHNAYPPRSEGGVNPSAILRSGLDLYANVRPARTRAGLDAPSQRTFDLVLFRENTEGFYADRNMPSGPAEFAPDADMALAMRKITRRASARIADAAFAAAEAREARKVTAVHKANVLRLSDGLFLEETRAAAARHPSVSYDEVLVDAMAAHLVREPERFDVIVTTNMFGDILSDLASELSGGLGLAASLNHGDTYAMAQAQHGSAPDIAGQGIANPSSLIGSASLLLDWLGRTRQEPALSKAGHAISTALDHALRDVMARTPDIGGKGSTMVFASAVAALMKGEG